MDDKDIQEYLNRYQVPPMRSDLCERIVAASRLTELPERRSLWVDIQDILIGVNEVLLLPRPAYVCASVLLVSLLLGAQIDIDAAFIQNSSIVDPSNYMEVYGSFGTEYQMVGVIEEGEIL